MQQKIEDKIEEIRASGFDFKFSFYFSKAWEIFSFNSGMMILYTILLFLGLGILSLIPLIGGMIRLLFQTPLIMGYAYVTYRIHHHQAIEFGNYFDGIKDFAKIFVINLLTGICIFIAVLPALIYIIYMLTNGFDFSSFNNPGFLFDSLNPLRLFKIIIVSFILLLPALYLSIGFQFSSYFVVFAGADYGTSIKWSMMIANKHVFSFILLDFTLAMLVIVSVLPLGLGLFVSIPFALIIKYVMFHDILAFDNISHANRDEVQDYLNETPSVQ